ncbi:MAG: FKBP-type peptidyl-prolyl cis-trans isomerase [Bacteroidales bacterium]|nr:FKBP-type peptidyl-prolyl cis-trans isomerase [Bacteroidales bacterium]
MNIKIKTDTHRMNRLILIIIVLSILFQFVSCSRHPGYKRAKNGTYYQLHKFGEDTVKIAPGDYITVNLTYMTMDDSAFFEGTRKFQVTEPAFRGSVDECFLMLSEEDCATFILNSGNFFGRTLQTDLPAFLSAGEGMKITADVLEVQTESEYQKEKEAFLNWIMDFGDYEKVVLQQYIAEEEIAAKPLSSGIYYFPIREGSGKIVEVGDTVEVHYEGRFLNGKFFDSTIKRNQSFQFVYGTEYQVIKGLEEAIGMMQEGERSLFIVPSEMAFGKTGSSTGIIPPYTSLIFEVEILKVSSSGKI